MGIHIRALHRQSGLTFLDIERNFSVAASVVCKIVNGQTRYPRYETALKLSAAYGVTVEEFYDAVHSEKEEEL